jgi:hypothetical protein
MKRSTIKKRLRLEEKHVADTLMLCFQPSSGTEEASQNDKWNYLGFTLAYLLMDCLALYHPQWPHRQRWIDDIGWESLKVIQPGKFRGTGKLWWGNRSNVGDEMVQTPIKVELHLLKAGKRPRIAYKLEFMSDGVLYRVES